MGIHREVKGIHGFMLNTLAKSMPDYVAVADTVVYMLNKPAFDNTSIAVTL